jgi:hypothetical protein
MWTDWDFWHKVLDLVFGGTWILMAWMHFQLTKRVERYRKHIFGDDYED